jgi:hypothetical protein
VARVFSYRVARDFGFAPNPFGGWCTVATCKPGIRRIARPGDLIIGCGSVELGFPERLIFAMRVAEKLSFDRYWNDSRFARKRPSFHSSRSRAYGDNIYHRDEGVWCQADSHHSFEDGVLNQANANRDLSADSVLVGNDFTYWGRSAIPIPANLRNIGGQDLFPHPRGHRSNYTPVFVEAVKGWFDGRVARGLQGRPASW